MTAPAVARPRRGYLDGLNNEQRLKAMLTGMGCTVRRVEHGGDVAYPLKGWHQQTRLPALQCWWNEPGRMTWVAAEWKATCGVIRVMGNLPTTGIDRARFLHFQAVEQLTGHPVVLAFVHKAQDAVVITDLRANLLPAVGRGSPMSFYSYGALRRVCGYQDFMALAPPAPSIEEPLFSPPADGHRQLDLFGKAF